jgi:hypothetical protein
MGGGVFATERVVKLYALYSASHRAQTLVLMVLRQQSIAQSKVRRHRLGTRKGGEPAPVVY